MSEEYIKRDDAINKMLRRFWEGKESMRDIIESIPAADVRPVVRAYWKEEAENK